MSAAGYSAASMQNTSSSLLVTGNTVTDQPMTSNLHGSHRPRPEIDRTTSAREVALDAVSLFDHLKHEMDYLEWSLEPGYTCGSANAPNREGKPQHASVDVSEEMGFENNAV